MITELTERRRRGKQTERRTYLVTGQSSMDAAIAAVNTGASSDPGNTVAGYTLDTGATEASETNEADTYTVTVEWQSPEEQDDNSGGPATVVEIGDVAVSFRTAGRSRLIRQSIANVAIRPTAQGTGPDFKGAINVTDAGVEGVEIVVAGLELVVTHRMAIASVDNAFIGSVNALTGTVNSTSYRGLDPGEGLLLGVSGRPIDDEAYDVEYVIATQQNQSSVVVDGSTPVSVKGWEYTWVRYQQDEDATAGRMVQRPLALYVEQVYPETSWSALP